MSNRLHEIRNILYTKKEVYTNELANYYKVSTVSIRKDLGELEREGVLTRVYGGGILKEDVHFEPEFVVASEDPILHKIAQKACEQIEEGDIIFLGSGKTCCFLAKMLHHLKNISVVTNNLAAIDDLLRSGAKIHLIGGEVTSTDGIHSFSSPENPKDFIDHICVNKAFTSTSGIDLRVGLTVKSVISTYIYTYIPTIASSWYILADSSKFNKLNMYPAGPLDKIDYLITNNILPEFRQMCDESGVSVLEVNTSPT